MPGEALGGPRNNTSVFVSYACTATDKAALPQQKKVSMEKMLIDASSVHMRNRRSKHNTGQDTRSGTC